MSGNKPVRSSKSSTTRPRFPKAWLDEWVLNHTSWSHGDWESLLNDLRSLGYNALAESNEGRELVGSHIEEARMNYSTKLRDQVLAATRRDLDRWLEKHASWDHQDWNSLLGDLCKKGHHRLVNHELGQKIVGDYLEAEKRRRLAGQSNEMR